MDMKLETLEGDPQLKDVVVVRVPGIYGTKGDPLPRRMARLVRPAALALQKVYDDVVSEGGHLFLSDMFRSAADQQKAHEDWKTGRKTAFSPPAGGSVHESGRAIDIDAFDTGIGHKRVRELLNRHGWVCIVETLTGAECWHYEFRQQFEQVREKQGYPAMARAMIEAIGNSVGTTASSAAAGDVRWLQESLNLLLGTTITVDGTFEETTRSAVREFQKQHGLQEDGVAGPITMRAIREARQGVAPAG